MVLLIKIIKYKEDVMRFLKSFLSLVLVVTMGINMFNTQVYASEEVGETEYITMEDGTRVKLETFETKIIITYLETGEVERIIQEDLYNVTHYDTEGIEHKVTGDDTGNVYYDGKLMIESSKEKMLRASSPWGSNWIYLTTAYTEQGVYDATAGLAVAVLSFVPGLGIVTGIASIVMAFASLTRPMAYYKIVQYYSKDMTQVRERVYVYSDSARKNCKGYKDSGIRRIF